jgi:hypothetical protein
MKVTKCLNEYLVVVYCDNNRLGAYTLFAEDYDTVWSMASARLNDNESSFRLVLKGTVVFTDEMLGV